MSQSLIIAAVLLLGIAAFEGWRRRERQPFGLLSVANVVFVLNYCVPPFFIAFIGGTDLEVSPFGTAQSDMRLYLFPLMEKVGLSEDAYGWAGLFAVYGYVTMLGGYASMTRFARKNVLPLRSAEVPLGFLLSAGLLLGGLAVAALLLFSHQFHGFAHFLKHDPQLSLYQSDPTGLWLMMKLGAYVRGDIISVSRGYLQIVVLLGLPGVMFLSAAAFKAKNAMRWVIGFAAVCVWLVVLTRMFYAAGRLEFVTFVAIFPLAAVFMMRSRLAVLVIAVPLVVFVFFMAVLGKDFFQFPAERLADLFDVMFVKTGQSILFILNEFSFPYVISANTIQIVPEEVGYRYFIDLPLAALYLLPSFGGADTWPRMISHIHLEMLPLMPIDLVSFGYYALGAVGVGLSF